LLIPISPLQGGGTAAAAAAAAALNGNCETLESSLVEQIHGCTGMGWILTSTDTGGEIATEVPIIEEGEGGDTPSFNLPDNAT